MIELGKKQELEIVKKVEFGVYLAENQEQEQRVLLPAKQVPGEAGIGDRLEVFLYKDSSDRLIATTNEPALTLGQVALLKVAEVGKIGAFLEWGLEKDLLLPFREQTKRVQPGDTCLAALYKDKSDRLCATMKLYPYLRTDSPYKKEDQVTGRVYEISEQFGIFVAVDDCYSARIPEFQNDGSLQPGDPVSGRVTAVKEDGKLDLSIREKAYLQRDTDAELILAGIKKHGGILPFHDKADPEVIKAEFGMSKNAFKRAVGKLLKEGKIEITGSRIKLLKK